jgi:hypothetical protein
MTTSNAERISPDAIIGMAGEVQWQKNTPFDHIMNRVEGPWGRPLDLEVLAEGGWSDVAGKTPVKALGHISAGALVATAASIAFNLPNAIPAITGSVSVVSFYARTVIAAYGRREARGLASNPVAFFPSLESGAGQIAVANMAIEEHGTELDK